MPLNERVVSQESYAERKSGYIPTLDGWRALAILAVIFHHAALLTVGPFSTRWLYQFGDTGVQVFFAISGLLICTRLLQEESKTGRLHLHGFYVRRLLRIQPASLLFLLVVLLLKVLHRLPLSWSGFFAALCLVRNYLPAQATGATDFATLHFWSLSVEEHFYLLLPAFLVLVPRHRVRVLLGLSVVLLLWSGYASRHGLLGTQAYHRTDLTLPALLLPSVAAILLQRQRLRLRARQLLQPVIAFALALVTYVPIFLSFRHAVRSLAFFAPAILVGCTVLHRESLPSRLLECKPLRFIGRISFGLYLWQELLFTGHFAPQLRPFGVLGQLPWSLPTVFALATASYYLVERPAMRLGHRLSPPAVAGRPELAQGTDQAGTTAGQEPPLL